MPNIPLKPNNELFTDTQWQAIFDGGDNILVSASAGSGKTTVLVRRVIEKLKLGSHVDRLLIVTFTEAAANEMKERIQVALQDAINAESDEQKRAHFSQQLMNLPTSHISTLHSFCLSVIRKYYYLIDLDPNFRLLSDETEQTLLMDEALENVINRHYESEDDIFYQFVHQFGNDRSDEGMLRLILDLYRFGRANDNPDKWLNHMVESYEPVEALEDYPIFNEYTKPYILSLLADMIKYLEQALTMIEYTSLEKVEQLLKDDIAMIQAPIESLKQNQLTQAFEQIQNMKFARYTIVKKDHADYDQAQLAKSYREMAKELLANAQKSWPTDPELTLELIAKSQEMIKIAVSLTKEFMVEFSQLKRQKSVLDFNDLEHFALAILRHEVDGVSIASDYYRQTFDEVLVDEYQDVNRLQETIISYVRKAENPGNMFMVGDVKQSIYAFRQADPTLFIEKYTQFAHDEDGRRIILAENFRSRKEVLDFTNLIFEQLMDQKVGQIEYDEAAQLKFGFTAFPSSEDFHTELLIYEKQAELDDMADEFGIDDKTQGEFHVITNKIQELIEQKFQIYDKKQKKFRDITYGDCVILSSTRKNHLHLLDIFAQKNIPVQLADAQNYFQATEVQTILAVLKIIDNPLQDIPFVAVLRSPIVGLNEKQLAQIRINSKKERFYDAFLENLSISSDYQEKIAHFYQQLLKWRNLSKRDSLENLLWTIYQDTGFLDFVGGMPSGVQRQMNLLSFISRAKSYEQSSFKGLYQFIRFIQIMQEKEHDLAKPVSEIKENAVQIMTIHQSKGLEFPVCFVVDLAKKFNQQDFKNSYILEEKLGMGTKFLDEQEIQYPTLPYLVINQLKKQKAFSEEMRKLYVALTRAEQKLYLVGTVKDKESMLNEWQKAAMQENTVLSPMLRLNADTFINWIGYCLIRHESFAKEVDESIATAMTIQHPAKFGIHFYQADQLVAPEQNTPESLAETSQQETTNHQALDEYIQQMTKAYDYPLSTKTASYQSVSELKRLYEDPDEEKLNKLVWQNRWQQETQGYRKTSNELAIPKFMQEVKITGAEIGSATHKLLQLIDVTQPITPDSLHQLVQRLKENQILDEKLVSKIPYQHILWFFQSTLGQRVIQNAQSLKREVPFAMLKEANEIFQDFDEKESHMLVHGVVDGYFIENEQIILFDFKTDYFKNNIEETAKERYYGQLKLYSQALSQALQLPVSERKLVLLTHQKILDF
ncbi:helicase-exonuclease AddAB subunit AddA [Enterococcus cecorum]|uniref:ATP-dependent helicase/nuclease subunit A n=1 Tax=Enterococcus cecorum DSM 20682 = ATCC 43198 TaxID=1121864 RepID=S1RNP1_9ENTE|nr:helicase-exonuclease AddAB subunit AddA [Enterococcus cecorum]EOX18142.1 helicase-exonuclease AddAB, AddA subunit [Enterococcus cecorum DSM 20682 = ATCC 43198]ESK62273.1 helicase-exonuclease AddAB, AddA subunit [Enterococcus cecorum DSM 20682 = ATCC 43198]CAI3349605.1 helicase-exonuclease AddAB subunit AddA [Enterococcus cecorum DSM 20682 = ATCC 43198]SQE55165.1 helicase-exonuclease AddAB, AddA subunit [Enterococcus cecorum]